MKINYARCTREIKSRIAMAKAPFKKKQILLTIQLDFKFKEETSKVLHVK